MLGNAGRSAERPAIFSTMTSIFPNGKSPQDFELSDTV